MDDELIDRLANLERLANVIAEIPASEQFIGHIQLQIKDALLDVKRCLELIVRGQAP